MALSPSGTEVEIGGSTTSHEATWASPFTEIFTVTACPRFTLVEKHVTCLFSPF